jgi:hypothetical protein
MAVDTWLHRDSALAVSVEWAHSRAANGDWASGSPAQRTDHLRALIAETAAAIGYFAGTVMVVPRETGAVCSIDLRPRPETPQDRLAVAGRLYATWRALQMTDDGGAEGGLETQSSPDTAALLPAVAIVAIAVIGAVAIGYCANQAAQIIDRQLLRSEQSRRLVAVHAAALKAVEQHQTREDEAGRSLPIDAATQQFLDSLKTAQESVIARREEAFESFVPKSIASGAGLGLGAVPWILGGLALAYVALK